MFSITTISSYSPWHYYEDVVLIAQTEEELNSAARKMTETRFSCGSADNITCIVVKFHHERGEPEQTQQHARGSAEPSETQYSNKPNAEESQQKPKANP
ncbi:putative protein phosphatase 2C 76 [Sesamum angolense]|uniref:Uncharacterized protein n=1 Tax=Sesamum angolense TaxID=2727404 RepID=A0AAE1W3R1_9LAMI|nr:putative protein phosphatase 2C 76 [Sesamum angolense]